MSYGVKIIIPNTNLPVTLVEVKAQIKHALDSSDTTEDALLTSYIHVARELIENYCRTRLLQWTEELYIDQFPFEYQIQLNKWPIASITYCHYLDINGAEQALDGTAITGDYIADTVSKPGRLCLQYARFWPVTRWIDNAVWVRYVVGNATTADIPYMLKQALFLIVGHFYENRFDTITQTHIEQIPMGAKYLMDMNRYKRL